MEVQDNQWLLKNLVNLVRENLAAEKLAEEERIKQKNIYFFV